MVVAAVHEPAAPVMKLRLRKRVGPGYERICSRPFVPMDCGPNAAHGALDIVTLFDYAGG